MTCPKCRGAQVVEISLSTQGSVLTMHSCTGCEARWWDREGERVGLSQVLSLVK